MGRRDIQHFYEYIHGHSGTNSCTGTFELLKDKSEKRGKAMRGWVGPFVTHVVQTSDSDPERNE